MRVDAVKIPSSGEIIAQGFFTEIPRLEYKKKLSLFQFQSRLLALIDFD
jgi:hypothetical protein